MQHIPPLLYILYLKENLYQKNNFYFITTFSIFFSYYNCTFIYLLEKWIKCIKWINGYFTANCGVPDFTISVPCKAAEAPSSSLCVPEALGVPFFQRKLLNGDLLLERSFRLAFSSTLDTSKNQHIKHHNTR